MDVRSEHEKDNKRANIAKSYKAQEVEESHDHSYTEGTWQIKENRLSVNWI